MYLQRPRGGVPLREELPHHEYKVVAPSNQSKSPDWAAGETSQHTAHCCPNKVGGGGRKHSRRRKEPGPPGLPPILPPPPLSIYLNFGGLCRGPAGPSFTPRVLLVHTQKNSTLDEERPAEAASNRPSPSGTCTRNA